MRKSGNELGTVVREARKNKGLSQEALAEKIGVSKRTIIDIENNTGNPRFEMLYLLVRELDLPLYRVFYPEASDDVVLKNTLLQELNGCSEQEMKFLLSVAKSMREAFMDGKVVKAKGE